MVKNCEEKRKTKTKLWKENKIVKRKTNLLYCLFIVKCLLFIVYYSLFIVYCLYDSDAKSPKRNHF